MCYNVVQLCWFFVKQLNIYTYLSSKCSPILSGGTFFGLLKSSWTLQVWTVTTPPKILIDVGRQGLWCVTNKQIFKSLVYDFVFTKSRTASWDRWWQSVYVKKKQMSWRPIINPAYNRKQYVLVCGIRFHMTYDTRCMFMQSNC